ncbi:MAG: hypothetical protein ACYC5X_12640 [Syntrophales bacterium]
MDAPMGIEVGTYCIQEILPIMVHLNIILEGVESSAANIVKKKMLSIG